MSLVSNAAFTVVNTFLTHIQSYVLLLMLVAA